MILENMVKASLLEENCAASSTWTCVMVAGWLPFSIFLIELSRRLRVMAIECAQPAKILLYTVMGVPEKPATCIIPGGKMLLEC